MDNAVLATQQWLNATYSSRTGWVHVNEDGLTGWNVIYGLTRALQVELGITTLNQNFGTQTEAQLTSKYPNITAQSANVPTNIVKIIQGAMYSKGFNGAGAANGNTITLDGVFGSQLTASVNTLRTNMGLGAAGVTVRIFKALLNMDAFVLVSGGDATIRQIQQSWNGRYQTRSAFNIIPTDGRYSRPIQRALMYAIQYELGMDDATANGNFGNLTKTGLQNNANFGSGSSGNYLIHLFQAALRFNGYPTNYDGVFGSSTAATTSSFQSFVSLPQNGRSTFSTWASLLVSTGDVNRTATGVDCVTTINSTNGPLLYSRGYRVVGRYLTNLPSLDKNIKPGEIQAIFNAGMKIFPIFQTYGGTSTQFNYANGRRDAEQAYHAALRYGFRPALTTIYFAVDWDATDDGISERVLPYFRGVRDLFRERCYRYKVGIYGARNICSRVSAEGLAVRSFVSDMSTGYSGNLGYPLPSNWAFDQIQTVTVSGSGTSIEIDRNVVSGRDNGQSSVGTFNHAYPYPFTAVSPGDSQSSNYGLMRDALMAWSQTYTTPEYSLRMAANIESVMNYLVATDDLVTQLSRKLGMRKTHIQTILAWESSVHYVQDNAADAAVISGATNDSSTGAAQIFAFVARRARNWARGEGLLNEPEWTLDNHRDLWFKLHDDQFFNVESAAYNLLYEARSAGFTGTLLNPTESDIEFLLTRYNDHEETEATDYGRRLVTLWNLFDQFNMDTSL